jgi:pimeloyl-ACP methyl ester carboxylesterase
VEHSVDRRDYFLTTSNVRFHVTEWGAQAAAPIVMLHGIRGYAETFLGVAAALQPTYRVIAFDQRGRGESDWDPHHDYYTDTYVRDLQSLVGQIGLDRFSLLGHSMGGINAIVYAALYPDHVDRLVIEDAGPGAFEASAGASRIRKELATTPAFFASWEEAEVFMRGLRPTVSEAARQQRLKSMLKELPDGRFTWRYDHQGICETRLHPDPSRIVNLEEHLKKVRCPTLVIRGARSDYLQPEMVANMQSLNSAISAVVIPDAGHYIHDDQPARFEREVRSFLQR